MNALTLFLLACMGAAWAQTPPPAAPLSSLPDLPDSTVVAVFDDGTKLTMEQFKKICAALPQENRQMVIRNRQAFLHQYALMRKLTGMAEKQKLDQESPTKEAIEYNRMIILTQAKLNEALNATPVDPQDVVKFYDANKERFKQVRAKAIYVAFSSDPAAPANGKKALTEDQAKAKAVKLLAEIRGGADFVKLVRENSDDETSKAKDGDFATLRPSDNIPDAIRAAVFALKQGDVSEPVRQPNGFYLLRADEVKYRALAEVRDEIFAQLKQKNYGEWMRQIDNATKVEFPNPLFLGSGAPLASPPASSAK